MAAIAILNFAESRITEEQKYEIVRAHNYFRGKVDPLATNMEQMVSYCNRKMMDYSFQVIIVKRFDLLLRHLLVYRCGMMSWHTWHSSGPLTVNMS